MTVSGTVAGMPPPVKRPAQQRKDRARETRVRMTAAAHALFVQRGYAATTMADIAAEAGVAVQTLYFTFHTKAALLQAAFERALLGDDPRPPEEQPWFAAMVAEPDPRAALRLLADGVTGIFERVAGLFVVARAVANEPDVVEVVERSERLRREGYARIVAGLAARGALREGLAEEWATDVLFVLHGPATYHAFTAGCGWSRAEWVDWVAATLAAQLLAAPDA